MNRTASLRIGSLFTGYGGLDMATQAAFGATTAWVSDIDKGACKILAHRYPDIPNLGDITSIDWSTVEPVDIITGGSPCQDLSHAGRRAGMTEGTRSNLWVAMREAIAQLRPRYVVWENVRGAASAEAASDLEFCTGCMGDPRLRGVVLRALGRVVGDLSDLGYVGHVRGLRAADAGACHPRFRIFIVAENADVTVSDQRRIAASREASSGRARADLGRPDRARTAYLKRVAGITTDPVLLARVGALLPTPDTGESPNGHGRRGGKSGNGHQSGATLDNLVTLLPTPAVNDMGKAYTPDEWDAWTAKMKAAHGNGNGHGKSLEIEAARLLPTPSVALADGGQTSRSGTRKDELLLGGIVAEYSRFAQYAAAVARQERVFGLSVPSPTEPTGKGGAHRLSPRFTEWMMGLPAGWITDVPGITRNEALKACGNGVVPQQAYAALVHMLNASEVAA